MDRQAMISALAEVYEPREASLLITYLYQDLFGGRNQLFPDENLVLEDAFHRLLKHEPLQYITGKAYFRDLILYVTPGVLIPRPETEELVNFALVYAQNRKISHILDIGTGSGCIALSLKKKLPDVKITAIDKSEEALAIARKNAIDLDLAIDLKRCDFLLEQDRKTLTGADLIVSNPPYIGREEEVVLAENVLAYEPHMALFADDDPLIFYKAIAAYGGASKTPVICEINERLGAETQACFVLAGYKNVVIYKDMQGKDRIIMAH